MKVNQLKAGVLLSYGTQVVHILTGLIYTPLMLRLLGQSEYGLYQLVYSVVSYLSLLSMGFGSGYIRFYSRYKAEGNEKGVAKINGMFMTIFSIIAIACLLCGIAMIFNVDAIFKTGLTTEEKAKAQILLGIMVLNMAITFFGSVFTSYVTAHEQFFFQRLLTFLKAIFNPLLTLPFLIMGFGSVSMVVVTTCLTMAVFIMDVFFCIKKLKMKFNFKEFDFGLLKEMWVFTFFIFINMIVDRINWSIDQVLLGRMIGTGAVAVYGVAGQLNQMYINMSSAVSGVFIPRVNMLVAKETDDNKISELFSKVGRIQFIIMALIISGYILYGREFIAIWAGKEYGEISYLIGLFLMVPVTIPLVQNLGIEIQRAKNKHKVRSFAYLFIAIANIFLSIFLIKKYGEYGAAIGTGISFILGNGIFMNIYYHKKLGLDVIYFWKEILKFLPTIGISVVCGLFIKHFIGCNSMFTLALNIIIYCIIYVTAQWLLGMNEYEKETFGKLINKFNRMRDKHAK